MPSPSSFWPSGLIRLRAGCMTTRINIYCTSPDYSEPLEQARLQQEQRNAPAMASRSWIRSKSVRHLPSFRCCARRAENRISAAPMSAVKPALEEAGGKYLARGGMHKVYEGDWEPRRIVLLEFSTFKAWEAFYK